MLPPVSYSFVIRWSLVGYYPSILLTSFPSLFLVLRLALIRQDIFCRVALSLLNFCHGKVTKLTNSFILAVSRHFVTLPLCHLHYFCRAQRPICYLDFAKYPIIKILLNLFTSLPLKQRAKLRFFFELCKFLRVYTRALIIRCSLFLTNGHKKKMCHI